MNRSAVITGISLVAGFAAAALVFTATEAPTSGAVSQPADPAVYFDQSAATDDRIAALETAVAQERSARLLLEEELQALYAEIEKLDEQGGSSAAIVANGDTEVTRADILERRQRIDSNDREKRLQNLVSAGFPPDRADWIMKRESELQMAQMQAIFEARQSGERPDWSEIDPQATLRREMGDVEYEQYLEANGQPTSVAIRSVLESSPGQRAGLQPGDEIVAYGGERVFNYGELASATMRRESGESVVVDIMRDGMPMQVVLESGPIGISGQNRAFSIRR